MEWFGEIVVCARAYRDQFTVQIGERGNNDDWGTLEIGVCP